MDSVAYVCDEKQCSNCGELLMRDCYHTTDIRHAKNFVEVEPGKFMEIYVIPPAPVPNVGDKDAEQRIQKALDIAWRYSQIDGAWHKAWSIDQMVRALFENEDDYKKWVYEYENDGEYTWDVGIAP
jgi:hypothetical protein